MSLDSIVNITIDAQTTAPTRAGFGTPMIAGYTTVFAERIRFFTQLTEMTTLGFSTSSALYKAAQAVFAQNPRPTQLAIGRLDVANTMVVTCTPVVQNTHLYTVTINGVDFTFTSDGSATAAEIVAGLVAAINGGTEPVTASGSTTLILTADVAGTNFELEVDYSDLRPNDDTADTCDIEAQLAAITVVSDAWYALHLVDRSAAITEAAAAYIETVKKIFVATSGDYDILTSSTTDLASALQDAAYARTALLFSRLPHKASGAAWAGNQLPFDPGSTTWAFKTLAGVPADSFPDAGEIVFMKAKNCNYYSTVAGINVTQQGKTASGEFIDVTIFLDWLKARMQERIFSLLANSKKIPFTAAGIGLIENTVRAQLAEGVRVGGLEDDDVLQVTVPLISEVDPVDKANRLLKTVRFQATLAGAVHELVVIGTILV